MNRYNKKIAAELVVSPREVLEARPRSCPPASEVEPHDHDATERDERAEDWDNSPCTD